MRIVGVTQGSNLRVFLRLAELLGEQRSLDGVAAFVSDSMAFKALTRKEPGLTEGVDLLKEWEFVDRGMRREPDWHRIAEFERDLGDPVFWNTLMADRRIYFGRRCKMRQDYRPRFSHRQMGGILQTALEEIDTFLQAVEPDLIIGFGTSTLGDYLFYRFAKGRDIPYLQLKATKIGNRVALNDDAVALSGHIADALQGRSPIPDWAVEIAQSYLEDVRQRGVRYEGAIARRRRHPMIPGLTALARGLAVDIRRRLDPVTRADNHPESMFQTYFHERFRNPIKGAWIDRRLGRRLITAERLAGYPAFVFFPLHFEPEVSLQVFGRPYQNQIELIRTLAASLPAGMDLLVKEHPRARGYRPWGYYRKLLEIPNVRLIDALLPTHLVVEHAALVAVISGSTGLEAAICGRPVITFGTPVYNALHGNMIRHVTDLNRLGWEIRDLLDNHQHDEPALQDYIAATVIGSVPVDLYTVLLGKPGRMREGRDELSEEQRRQEDYRRLAEYCGRRIEDVFAATGRTV